MLQRIVGRSISLGCRMAHTLPPLPYEYNALEPVISSEIMKLHHQKHHATYVNNYNAAETKLADALKAGDTTAILSLQSALKFNGGGHLNHAVFWTNLSPNGGGVPGGDIIDAINSKFGSFDEFKDQFSKLCIAVQGSGWGWLGYDPRERCVEIATTSNQDPLQPTTGMVPLLGIDVWEHAYYLQYKNVRPDYVKAIWNIINWDNVNERFHIAKMEYA